MWFGFCERLGLLVTQLTNAKRLDLQDIKVVAQPIAKHFNASVAKGDDDAPVIEQRRLHNGADHVEDDGLVFFLDAIDRIDEKYGSAGGPSLHEKLLQGAPERPCEVA